MEPYDLIVIGGGPAGYLGAQRAAKKKKRVLLFEKNKLGGVCLNEGCIPTKTLLNSAKIYEHTKNGNSFGILTENVLIDPTAIQKRKNRVIHMLVGGVKMTMKKHKVEVIYQQAKIKGKTDRGFLVEAEGEIYEARNLLIAAGSQPVIPPIKGGKEAMESGLAVISRELLDFPQLPNKLVIVGAGVIGLEMAAYFAGMGTKVTVVEMLDKIAGTMDRKITKMLQKELEKKGIQFMLGYQVTEIEKDGVVCKKEDQWIRCKADKILWSVGRHPIIKGLGLESVNLKIENGKIVTDEHLRTSVEGIYAAGDVNGKMMLAHTAYRESETAVNDMFGIQDTIDYGVIPSVIYTNPELASVGETEESAKEKGLRMKTVEIPMAYSGRFVAENDGIGGICKLLMDQDTGCLAGAHILGSYASEMIWGIGALMEQKVTIEEMKKIVFPHPSVSEIIREAIFKF